MPFYDFRVAVYVDQIRVNQMNDVADILIFLLDVL